MLYIRNSGNNNSNYPSFNNLNRTNVVRNNVVSYVDISPPYQIKDYRDSKDGKGDGN